MVKEVRAGEVKEFSCLFLGEMEDPSAVKDQEDI